MICCTENNAPIIKAGFGSVVVIDSFNRGDMLWKVLIDDNIPNVYSQLYEYSVLSCLFVL